ncbi:MAG: phosphoribosylamine--glycine ligase [Candidatus Krumholzibacteriia bacterium]
MADRIIVLGAGGREHALVRQLSESPQEPRIFVAPGNAGTAQLAENVDIDLGRPNEVVRFCLQQEIGLALIGPEEPLIAGLADHLRRAGVSVFGPGAMGARLEGDKEFAKEVMAAAGVPTPSYRSFSSVEGALDYLDKVDMPVVVKATGAAQGKGVAVCVTRAEAEQHVLLCLQDQAFGAAGLRVLIEECLFGRELSVLCVTDGQTHALLAPSRDHKRVGDGDTGPNTGGMGAFAPVELPAETMLRIDAQVITPMLAELRRRDIPYRGVLYAGLMLTDHGLRVLEFNCRFGDPETQVVLPLLKGDFLELVRSTADGELDRYLQGVHIDPDAPADWTGGGLTDWSHHCVVVVAAARGYPGPYRKGIRLQLPPDRGDAWIIHAGTRREDGDLVSAGGRVLGAVGVGRGLVAARGQAYRCLDEVQAEGLFYRRDIGAREEEESA